MASFDKHLYALDLGDRQGEVADQARAVQGVPGGPRRPRLRRRPGRQFYCLDAADGRKVWQFETDGEINAGANFHGGNVLVGSHDSSLYCLDADGKKVWALHTDGPVNGSPAVVGDLTFVAGCDSILHVVDARTGADTGTVDLGGQAGATAAVAGDFAFVGTMSNEVVAVNWRTKSKAWAFEAAKRQQPFYASAAVAGDVLVTGSRDKKVYAIDRKSGKEVWTFATEGQVDASPVIVGDRVYVGCLSDGGQFYALDLKTGQKRQELDLDSAVSGSAAVGTDCLYVGTSKGTVYSLGTK